MPPSERATADDVLVGAAQDHDSGPIPRRVKPGVDADVDEIALADVWVCVLERAKVVLVSG